MKILLESCSENTAMRFQSGTNITTVMEGNIIFYAMLTRVGVFISSGTAQDIEAITFWFNGSVYRKKCKASNILFTHSPGKLYLELRKLSKGINEAEVQKACIDAFYKNKGKYVYEQERG